MREALFFGIALGGIALIAWQAGDDSSGNGPGTFESVVIVAAVLFAAHTLRHLYYRFSGRQGDR